MGRKATRSRTCLAFALSFFAFMLAMSFPFSAHATELPALTSGQVRIHVLPFNDMDAIVVECDGHFGMVDSAEDSLSPDGSDFRYPQRPGTTDGQGKEAEVIAYLKSIGVTQDNFDFYIGTHPHSDHIGTAVQVIHEFHPKTIYTPIYDDSIITDYNRLWDNQFVYDRLVAAAQWAKEEYGARFIQHLDPAWTDPNPDPDPDPGVDPDPDPDPDPGVDPDPDPDPGVDPDPDPDPDPGVDPDPNPDPEVDPDQPIDPEELSIQASNEEDADDDDTNTGSPIFKLGSATIEIVNYDETYLTTKVPDANYYSYGVKVTATNGRSAFLAGDMNNYTDGDGNGIGDEDRLKDSFGTIDFLKMAHHGRTGSNTPDYLQKILKAAQGDDRCVVVQTGAYSLMPWETIEVLNEKGARHFSASDALSWGHDAFVADLTDAGVRTNVDGDNTLITQVRTSAPYAVLYSNGLPYADTGWHQGTDGTMYYFGEPGVDSPSSTPVTNCWATYEGNRVFIGNQGCKALGWQKIDDIWYYFNSDGSLRHGWQQISGKWYYLDPTSGAMVTGWMTIGSKKYYLDPVSGAMAIGWKTIDGKPYYFDSSGAMTSASGWVKREGIWYYATASGAYQTGWLKTGGKWYYLKETGAMATGWVQVDGLWYYLNASGAMLTGWQKIGGTWYHLKSSGAMSVGWLKDNGKWYYLKESGAMATGWAQVDGLWYYLNGSGAMQTGWKKIGSTWYHLKSSGAMSVGWLKDKGKWYYLKESGAMATGWVQVDGVWYRLNSSGAMLTGWQKIGSTWYHLKSSGAMSIGWLEDKGKTYYLTESVAMATGTHTIEGKQYRFSSSGALL